MLKGEGGLAVLAEVRKLVSSWLPLLLPLCACSLLEEHAPAGTPEKESAHTAPEHDEKQAKPAEPAHDPGATKYDVPFAWEVSKDEPLAKNRAFLGEAFSDNAAYMQHGPKWFKTMADGQTPRATVVTCADSRVHNAAWDSSPENDDFIVRNIGNQLKNAHGSVEYGIEHLHTPLLMVIGHTGCGAVKAAMGDTSKLSAPILNELKDLKVSKKPKNMPEEEAWAGAVIENVNNQVAFAVQHFGPVIREGKLTVVGAVYDLRNDLRGGFGKLIVVNVNGNSEPERMRAFGAAIERSLPPDATRAAAAYDRLNDAGAFTPPASAPNMPAAANAPAAHAAH